ncbi:hypothetical protein ACEWY4_003666 [Coilia grayii]|uniref:UMOD/GP2/OIT3-like D8C domain-containing protein n=1 Tax=Coilia grayii TaxID=363190 RepID=A0ABD1KRW4_9TELE
MCMCMCVCVCVCTRVCVHGFVLINPTLVLHTPGSTSAQQSDPCDNYTVLNATWRATTNHNVSVFRCDRHVQWQGWYLLAHQNYSVRMPESCVPTYSCGTAAPLWLNGSHPSPADGIVTRKVCASFDGFCCFHVSSPIPAIQVRACPGNYTVYKFVDPLYCYVAYCAGKSLHCVYRSLLLFGLLVCCNTLCTVSPIDHVVGMRLQVSSAERLNETAVEEQILKPLRELLRQRGVDISGIRLRKVYQK